MTKEEKKEYNRKWYAEHREQRLASVKQWQAEHREQVAETSRKWYAEHREQAAETSRKWVSATSASIYIIKNTKTDKLYVGSTTINPTRRWINHIPLYIHQKLIPYHILKIQNNYLRCNKSKWNLLINQQH